MVSSGWFIALRREGGRGGMGADIDELSLGCHMVLLRKQTCLRCDLWIVQP
jgi:hypothetical protein